MPPTSHIHNSKWLIGPQPFPVIEHKHIALFTISGDPPIPMGLNFILHTSLPVMPPYREECLLIDALPYIPDCPTAIVFAKELFLP